MAKFELSRAGLEARDIVADSASVANRIETYRELMPSDHPALIVTAENEQTMQAAPCVPEVNAEQFTAEVLRSAVAEHGALIVRNLFSQASMDTMINTIDQVLEACDDTQTERTAPVNAYHNPPDILKTIMPNKEKELGNTRGFHRDSGSAMCVEAPSVAESLLQLYEQYGLKELIGEYLGEPPCLSVKKWVLRRSKLPVAESGWHQDGAFMGADINSINMWIPLGECGGDTGAPGMDVVPQRLNSMVSSDGAQFDWSVSPAHVDGQFVKNSPLKPVFNAGDAFFFDHFYLHRTQFSADFTKLRYAIESWFFGASSFPKNQIPLAW